MSRSLCKDQKSERQMQALNDTIIRKVPKQVLKKTSGTAYRKLLEAELIKIKGNYLTPTKRGSALLAAYLRWEKKDKGRRRRC